MFSTPLICCSSGVATVRDTVSADAPGYTVVICTVGGTISGYCATGRIASAPSPRSVTKALYTVAKRGRSIKKCVRRMFLALFRSPLGTERSVLPAVRTKEGQEQAPDTFLYRTPSLRNRIKRFRDAPRARCARNSAGRTVPGNRPAHSADHHGVSGRIRGYGVAHRGDAARTADQWRREHALHEQPVDRRRQAHDHGYLPHRHRFERRTDADAKPCPGRFATVAGRRTAPRCASPEGDAEHPPGHSRLLAG